MISTVSILYFFLCMGLTVISKVNGDGGWLLSYSHVKPNKLPAMWITNIEDFVLNGRSGRDTNGEINYQHMGQRSIAERFRWVPDEKWQLGEMEKIPAQ